MMNLTPHTISIRMATPDDAYELGRLAQLDGATVPAAPVLLAERDGKLQAALSVRSGAVIADPFSPTAELLVLLRVRAARLEPARPVLERVRSAFSSRHARAYAA